MTDNLTTRLVIGNLSLLGMIALIGGIVLAGLGIAVPEWLPPIVSASLAGLLGWLAPSPLAQKD